MLDVLKLSVPIGELDAERFGKSVTEMMGGTGLEGLPVMHEAFDRIGEFCTGELLLFCLLPFNDRNRQHVLADVRIYVEHLDRFLQGIFIRFMTGVPFLPKEFECPQERTRRLFPAHDIRPLVIQLWKVSIRVDDVFVVLSEKHLRCWSDAQSFGKLFFSAVGHPRNFWSEAFDMILFPLE